MDDGWEDAGRPGAPARTGAIRRLMAAIAVAAAAGAAGCVEIDGGAVEVPWTIFAPPPDGRAITDCSCADPAIAYVRLDLVSQRDGSRPCDGLAGCLFDCGSKIGATPFVIPPDRYLMTLLPVGADGVVLSAIEVTPPLLRDVMRGQPTELEAVSFRAGCAPVCGGVNIRTPCSKD